MYCEHKLKCWSLVSGMVLHSCWRFLTKYRSEKSCIWCCSKYGASCNWYGQILNFYTACPSLQSSWYSHRGNFIGYSVVRSLSEAPRYASVISDILRNRVPAQYLPGTSQNYSPSMLGKYFADFYSTWLIVLLHYDMTSGQVQLH